MHCADCCIWHRVAADIPALPQVASQTDLAARQKRSTGASKVEKDLGGEMEERKAICADLFCGAGGTSSGLINAAKELGIPYVSNLADGRKKVEVYVD